MKKFLVLIVGCLLIATPVLSAEFSPTLMKLSADPVIQYDFDGSQLTIPVNVSRYQRRYHLFRIYQGQWPT